MESTKETVVITGISGFLGSWVCLKILQHGGYKVRGTVRSKTNEKKIAPLREAFGDLFNELELVEADLTNQASIEKALEGAEYVVHTASPFNVETVKNPEEELIKPAVNGTMSVMNAAGANNVKRVVLTSSCVSITASSSYCKP